MMNGGLDVDTGTRVTPAEAARKFEQLSHKFYFGNPSAESRTQDNQLLHNMERVIQGALTTATQRDGNCERDNSRNMSTPSGYFVASMPLGAPCHSQAQSQNLHSKIPPVHLGLVSHPTGPSGLYSAPTVLSNEAHLYNSGTPVIGGPYSIHAPALGHHQFGQPKFSSTPIVENLGRSVEVAPQYHSTYPEVLPTRKNTLVHASNDFLPNISDRSGDTVAEFRESSGQSEPKLKVEDALNYLDQVKYKFDSQPRVYNNFLDIMKEFKTLSIDVPSVITRVSNLFQGHPELIVGFNTFLPPGYKIEVDISNPTQVRPGIDYIVRTVLADPETGNNFRQITSYSQPRESENFKNLKTIHHKPVTLEGVNSAPSVTFNSGTIIPTNDVRTNEKVSENPSLRPNPTMNAESSGSNLKNNDRESRTLSHASLPTASYFHQEFPTTSSQPSQFNDAVTYVNKIKNRFVNEKEKYKKFLDILQIYQKGQRSTGGSPAADLTEKEVYSRVEKLFKNHDDLLSEFTLFMNSNPPDIQKSKPFFDAKGTTTAKGKSTNEKTKKRSSRLADIPSTTSTSFHTKISRRGRKVSESRLSTNPPPVPVPQSAADAKQIKHLEASIQDKYRSLGKLTLFDDVRRVLRAEKVYHEFLLSLLHFEEQKITMNQLMKVVSPVLSKTPELLSWLENFIQIGYPVQSRRHEPVASSSTLKAIELGAEQIQEIDLSTCKRVGASYCLLPKNHPHPKCSGRTELCKAVLNDNYVSFSTWSGDSRFTPSKKSHYEKHLAICEEERFELDWVLETNKDTIKCLETVTSYMRSLTEEELDKFQLDDCLGGTSPTLHKQAIDRLYGERAKDFIEGLKKRPSLSVPVVLKRLKEKQEEWEEAKNGFNEAWREKTERSYIKSLEDQGLPYQRADTSTLRQLRPFNYW